MTPMVITGANGFVGSHLADSFRHFGRVVEIDQKRRPNAEDFIEWDLRQGIPPDLPNRAETVIHCAAAVGSDPDGDGRDCFDVNVKATAQLLSYARSAGAKHFIFFSTGSVYGMREQACRDTDPLNPQGAYACSKAAAESLVRAYEPYLQTLCLRLFYPYGPGQQLPRLVPGIAARLVEGQSIPLNGPEGYPKINPLFIADLVCWVERLIKCEASGTYNLAGAEIVSIREIAERIASILETSARFDYQRPVAGHLIGDIAKVCKDTGISPAWTLNRGLAEAVRASDHGFITIAARSVIMAETETKNEKRKIGVVIPLFNEALNLPELIKRLESTMGELASHGYDFEVVFVDDHSTDETPEMVKKLLQEKTWLRFVRLSRNCGSYTALAAGLRYCSADCAILMAADLQDPPEVIPQIVAKWREGYEVVWAVRAEREGESRLTKLLAGIFYWLMRHMVLAEIPAKGADFLLMDRKAIDAYNSIPEKHTSFLAMVLWMGFRQAFISYVKQARHAGKSKWTLSKKLKLFMDSIISFSYAPIRIMTLFGFGMAFCGFIYACVVVIARLGGWVVAGTGFAALMTVLLIGQGSILIMLGILGEYLWRTFDEARGRPRYIIEEFLTHDSLNNSLNRGEKP